MSNGGMRSVVILPKTGREWYQKIKNNITKMVQGEQKTFHLN